MNWQTIPRLLLTSMELTNIGKNMTTRKRIYSKEYLQIMNHTLAQHSQFQQNMEINFADAQYNLVLKTPNMPITSEEEIMFNEVVAKVRQDYQLIQIGLGHAM